MKRLVLILIIHSVAFAQYSGVKPIPGTPIDRAHQSGNPVGYWLAGHGGNQLRDLSGNGNHATFYGDTHITTGKFGSCIDFDGTADWMSVRDDFTASDAFTIILWCKMGSVSGTFDYLLDNSNGSVGFMLRSSDWTSATDYYTYKTGPTAVQSTLSGNLADGSWHQLVMTRTNVQQEIYRDGILGDSDATGAALVTTTTPLVFGGEYDGDNPVEGQIDNIMIFDRALTVVEIQQLYYDPFCMFEREPLIINTAAAPTGGQVIIIQSRIPVLMGVFLLTAAIPLGFVIWKGESNS